MVVSNRPLGASGEDLLPGLVRSWQHSTVIAVAFVICNGCDHYNTRTWITMAVPIFSYDGASRWVKFQYLNSCSSRLLSAFLSSSLRTYFEDHVAMSSARELASVLADVNPCHFPSLVYGHVAVPTERRYSSSLSLLQELDAQGLSRQRLCKLAFALLLKAYIGTNSLLYGLLDESPSTPMASLVRADIDPATTLFDNYQRLASIPLLGTGNGWIEKRFRELEAQAGFKHFNTTLCFAHASSHEHSFENIFDSQMIICVESDPARCGSQRQNQNNIVLHHGSTR